MPAFFHPLAIDFLLFEFSIWVLFFARILFAGLNVKKILYFYNREKRKIKEKRN